MMFTVTTTGQRAAKAIMRSDKNLLGELGARLQDIMRMWTTTNTAQVHIVVRELVSNAIRHGNCNNESQLVSLRLVLTSSEWVVSVTDQGKGFYLDNVDLKLPEDYRSLRRNGLSLVNALVSKLVVSRSPNTVTAFFPVSTGTTQKEPNLNLIDDNQHKLHTQEYAS